MIKKIFTYHLLPFLVSITLVFGIYILVKPSLQFEKKAVTVKTKYPKFKGRIATFDTDSTAEAKLAFSLANKEQLTLFGSSEFSETPYVTFNYLADSLNIPVMGVGHAYHQSLSILVELLAMDEYNASSKITIFVSPTWFEKGTNTQAFAEFVRPNFLRRIIKNKSLDVKYLAHIGAYIYNNQKDFSRISVTMQVALSHFQNNASINPITKLDEQLKSIYSDSNQIATVNYSFPDTVFNVQSQPHPFEMYRTQAQNNFLKKVTNNNIYVEDSYFKEHLSERKGKPGKLEPINLESNDELEDFKLLVDYIAEKKMDASFIIIPVNPYHYGNTADYNPLIKEIEKNINMHRFACLNLFTSNKKEYQPGTLRDVMHFGAYGWLKVNQFLYQHYYE